MTSRPALLFGALVAGLGCDAADAEAPRAHQEEGSDPGEVCDLVARPSVYVVPGRLFDDYIATVDADAVWYEWEGETYEATCLGDATGHCTAWVAGWERTGLIHVFVDYCDVVVDTSRVVEIDDTGCHVVTQYVLQQVSTRGCLTAEPAPGPGQPPV